MILEELEHARKRGARIYAELTGFGMSGDAYHMTAPQESGEGARLAMANALHDAQTRPDQVDYVNAHATSTPLGDKAETLAIKRALGDHARKVAVSSTKSSMGHLIAAAGAVEGVVCALAIARGEMPVNANLREQDADCNLNIIADEPRRGRVRMTLSNSFGFGGSNSCVVMRHPDLVEP